MAEEYAQQVTNQAVARACVAHDFKTSYSSVISVLSDVAAKYAQNLAECAKDMAEAAGRPVIGTQDIIYALEQTVRD